MSHHEAPLGHDPVGQPPEQTHETTAPDVHSGPKRSLLLDWALLIAGCGAIFALSYFLT
jgi:hypothetical protein